ncbi:hypothetical protein SO802_020663 [Lithocarpus litseifolius]|uniref:CCHC-type domain-containing protein n=1 Tax=Lithocarpus litseifolius TaxID=425828 RepID=A0AAW2CEJ7_9ROSI
MMKFKPTKTETQTNEGRIENPNHEDRKNKPTAATVKAAAIEPKRQRQADSDSDEDIEEVKEGFALVSLSKETKKCIRAPWVKAFIVKEANFKPSKALVSSVAVWVRLNELPIEYYDATVLWHIDQALETVLRVDMHTATEARGRYACLCVQVDKSKPLVTTVRLGHHNQPVAYEGLNRLCFACGRLGHRREACQFTIKSPSLVPKDSLEPNTADKEDKALTSPMAQPEAPTGNRDASEDESSEATFGPWMVITRKQKDNRLHKKSSSSRLAEYRHASLNMNERAGGK